MDEADLGNEMAANTLAHALAAINPELEAQPTGECLNCGEPLKGSIRWCDVYCRNEWSATKDRSVGG